jgi:PAS domain S-box-containing protein
MPAKRAAFSLRLINQIPAMVAFWDTGQKCRFANAAYREWFGRTTEEMDGISLQELLGPLYKKNLPHIRAALQGRKQVFERRITLPTGEVRETVATYVPERLDGIVQGFLVHVSDVTPLRQRAAALEENIQETIRILEKTKGSFRSKELGALRQHLARLSRSEAAET